MELRFPPLFLILIDRCENGLNEKLLRTPLPDLFFWLQQKGF